jgi:hypothetical protein
MAQREFHSGKKGGVNSHKIHPLFFAMPHHVCMLNVAYASYTGINAFIKKASATKFLNRTKSLDYRQN